LKVNKINYKIIPAENDKRVKNKAICDNTGDYLSLEDGRAKWQARKSYGVNFAKVFYALGAEELKKAQDSGTLEINKKTGEVFNTPEARKYFLKSQRISECGLRLEYKVDANNNKTLCNALFCRDRLCPICMWRLSRRLSWETYQIIEKYTKQCPDMIPIMISLTVRNPKMGELSNMLDVLCHGDSAAWQLLRKWLSRRGIKDYIRTVEVTFNFKDQTWHPHLHVLAFVPKEYFLKNNKNYISRARLSEYWKHACKLDYKPVVDIRRCYDKNGKKERIKFDSDMKDMSLSGAIFETAKYCVKPLKIFSETLDSYAENDADIKKEKVNIKEVIRELDNALSGRRLRALGGRLKKIARELKIDDDESKKELIHNNNGVVEAVREEVYEYVFSDADYYLTARDDVDRERERQRDIYFYNTG
jgi:plasmid rolling circle replication initiator protein Rep